MQKKKLRRRQYTQKELGLNPSLIFPIKNHYFGGRYDNYYNIRKEKAIPMKVNKKKLLVDIAKDVSIQDT